MRLIRDEGHGNFRLVERSDDHIPPYAILSHTWGADGEEVTFKDLAEGIGKSKTGYKKIKFCRKQATEDGIQHFWVDTCCIDKSSNAELTEAINSMFRWYQNAFRCYVYLSDVSTSGNAPNLQSSPTSLEATLRGSRWFSRGWTLQKLIAPASVEFFSREGDWLGSKKSLEQQIHDLTGIAMGALRGGPLTDFEIEERLSWVHYRDTKRPEDKAYSLLGIFNIRMPLLYGEGREKAFVRLREMIGRPSKLAVGFGLNLGYAPQVAEGTFVGWQAEVIQGGVGKTQLNITFAKQHHERCSSIFWPNAKDELSLKQGFVRFSQTIGIGQGKGSIGPADDDLVIQKVLRWLSGPDNDRWLLIFDNYDDPKLPGVKGATSYDIRAYFPPRSQGSILITTPSHRLTFARQMNTVNILGNLYRDQGRLKEAEEMYQRAQAGYEKALEPCHTSRNFQVDMELKDALRASEMENCQMLTKSLAIWSSYSKAAEAKEGLLTHCIDVQAMLSRVPAYLANQSSGSPFRCKFEHTQHESTKELWLWGKSTWRTTNGRCNLPKKIMSQKILLGVPSCTPCDFVENHRFQDWPGVKTMEKPVKGNCIALLTLAWCYILSAKWVEMQSSNNFQIPVKSSDSENLLYLENLAHWSTGATHKSSMNIEIDLGGIDEDAARWWAAVLATGQGWEASIVRSQKRYLSPWSVSIISKQAFALSRLQTTGISGSLGQPMLSECRPASSDLALQYLSSFCALYGINGQCFAALAVALYIPCRGGIQNCLLPQPHLAPLTETRKDLSNSICNLEKDQAKLLPYYMMISCNVRSMRALLHGTFFEPTVPCNLVSPWLEGAFTIIDALVQSKDYFKLANVMGTRQPKIAPIWLGAIILGMESQVFRHVRTGMSSIEMLAAAWTGTAHSFLGPRRLIPTSYDGTKISRADECRLLYLADSEDHSRVPTCSWAPFGDTEVSDADLEVQEHAVCSGLHCLLYESWTWNLCDAKDSPADKGFRFTDDDMDKTQETCNQSLPLIRHQGYRLPTSELLSENATRNIFNWLRPTGYPVREKNIRTHSWIDIDYDDDDDDDEEDSDGAGNSDEETPEEIFKVAIEDWLSKTSQSKEVA
jgi:Heterokaryon incompatibility protein (HET)